ncbi:MAG: DegV family protein [Christensenellales bacterium]
MSYVIMIDSNSEIPYQFAEEHDLPVFQMPYTLNGKEYYYDLGKEIDIKDFYRQVRAGALPITSTRAPQDYYDFWKPVLEQGKDIIHISFSSKLSSAYSFASSKREEILEEFPDRKLALIDTLSISMGVGILIYNAVEMKANGASFEEVTEWIENNKLKVNHWFTVDDLNHLKRGGRVSGAAAFMGTILEIKPILKVNEEGGLVPVDKVKGRKKALRYLVTQIENRIVEPEKQMIAIMHADCEADADILEAMIKEKISCKEIWKVPVGPVIGSHAGAGTLALLFIGESR